MVYLVADLSFLQENTLVDDQGNAQLCDFGLAKILDDVPSGLTITKTTAWSLRYAAPELVANREKLHTLRSDVWAWGCLALVVSAPKPFQLSSHPPGCRS